MLWTINWVNARKLIHTYFMKIFPKKTHSCVRNVFCFNNVLECVQVFTNQLNTLEFERISFLSWRALNWFDLEYQLFTSQHISIILQKLWAIIKRNPYSFWTIKVKETSQRLQIHIHSSHFWQLPNLDQHEILRISFLSWFVIA